MNKQQINRHGGQGSYTWEGVLQFLYNQYQDSSQKQNIWSFQRDKLKENIKELEGKVISLEAVNKELKNRNNILEHALREMKIKNHEKRNKENEIMNDNRDDANLHFMDQLPKVPQRRPKPNKANLSKMLCSLGIPQLLEDIKKDLQANQPQISSQTQYRPEAKKGFQLDLSKMEAESRNQQNFERKITQEPSCPLEGLQEQI